MRNIMQLEIIRKLGWLALGLMMASAVEAQTNISNSPLVTSSSSSVNPNIFLMMDDSGSMDWDFMPDTGGSPYLIFSHTGTSTTYGAASSQCNGVYYNPNITYSPPYSAATGSSYPNSTFTNAWFDGYNTSSGKVDLSQYFQLGRSQSDTSTAPSTKVETNISQPPYPAAGAPAFYYTYQGAQTSAASKQFYNTSSTFYSECNATVGSITITLTVGGSGSNAVKQLAVGSTILISSGAISTQSKTSSLASAINTAITNSAVSGYTSSRASGSSVVNLTVPASAIGSAVTITMTSGTGMTVTANPSTIPAPVFTKVVVSSTSGPGKSDETTNFANWYSYYRTRINMMKSGTGLAFASINPNYRVGFATMNNNGGSDMVNPAAFTGTQKTSWYSTLYGTKANNSTPLLQALSSVGQLYAYSTFGKGSDTKHILNGVTANDPIQYSCQQNFAILSTDGFWNDSTNQGLAAGTSGAVYGTNVGEQDGAKTSPRPYCDGNSSCNGDSADTSNSGTSDTLADVAAYYYNNPIRSSTLGNCYGALGKTAGQVCGNNVPVTTTDTANWPHVTLFTLGLGAPGRMVFDPNYKTETATSTIHDYYDVAHGSSVNTSTSTCTWGTAGHLCEWPTPDPAGKPENIDDLWHAAVNGHGTYYSATDPNALAAGLGSALAAVQQTTGAAAAATTSSPNVTSTNNYVFSSTYVSGLWWGDVSEQTINATNGTINSGVVWTAAAQLDAVTYTNRTIYFNSSGALTAMTWSALSGTQQGYFKNATLSQFCTIGPSCLSSTAQTAASGQPLFNFVMGDRSNEAGGSANTNYYRGRTHILGDIVDAQAAYVGTSNFSYGDAKYSAFISTNSTRAGRVYVAANDGMLHALDATTGAEKWAFVPTAVIPNLYKLADLQYATNHQYYVDGTPVSGDVYFGGAWHTILVGGLNNGGNSYYALDVTDPTKAPTLLWEFNDKNLGNSYGNPIITKINGTWVVLVTSGYNNADGFGHVYVLDAQTGTVDSDTNTGVGSATNPSGLARITAWAANPQSDNTTLRVYGGDLLGNVWRFPVGSGQTLGAPQLLVNLQDSSKTAQPVTAAPELGIVISSSGVSYNVVFVGTGEYLGLPDLTNTQTQTMYAIKDTLATTKTGALYPTSPQQTNSGFVGQTLTDTTCPASAPSDVCTSGQDVRTGSSNAVDWSTNNGWYINFPGSGERDNTDPVLVLKTLVFNTNTPASSTSVCVAGGSSQEYAVDYSTGAAVPTADGVVSKSLGNAIATNPALVQLSNGTIVAISTMSNGTEVTTTPPISSQAGPTIRTGWHETN